ncbi:rhomboid family intramembrane serine protease [Schaalia sp. lx-100]|uniref:rhomboid family intramembrane serine protease n=1 Tax=Schaalia sp. lx-100 TaxID=2899081 RepID=UPI001E42BB04|nr:rhomboid family intramembrane serine protease [Schaalia sp. lx-100]
MNGSALYGQRSNYSAAPPCPRHPSVRSVDYCKRCNRPICVDCAIPTEVRSICVECSGQKRVQIRHTTPYITYTLMGACVVVYVCGVISPLLWQYMAFTPLVGLIQPWRFLSTAFLHSGIVHLLFNMSALYFVGISLEQILGKWRFIILYALSAIGGSAAVLAWVLFAPGTYNQITVGASGAVFGLFAAIFVIQKRAGLDTRSIIGLLVVNFLYGFIAPNISWQAHAGGMLTGLLVAWVLIMLMQPRPGLTARQQEIRSVLASVGMIVAMCALIALIYRVIFEVLGS